MGSISVIAGAAAAAAARRANSHRSHSSGSSAGEHSSSGPSERNEESIQKIIYGAHTNRSVCCDCEDYRMNTCIILQRPDGLSGSGCSRKFTDPRVYYGDSSS